MKQTPGATSGKNRSADLPHSDQKTSDVRSLPCIAAGPASKDELQNLRLRDPPAHLVMSRDDSHPHNPRRRLNGPEGRRACTPPLPSGNFGRPKFAFRRSRSHSSDGSHRKPERPRTVLSPTPIRNLRTSETLACGLPITRNVSTPVHTQTRYTKRQSLLPHAAPAAPALCSRRATPYSMRPLPSGQESYLNRSRVEAHQTFDTSRCKVMRMRSSGPSRTVTQLY